MDGVVLYLSILDVELLVMPRHGGEEVVKRYHDPSVCLSPSVCPRAQLP